MKKILNWPVLAFMTAILSALNSYATLTQENIDDAREYIQVLHDCGKTYEDIAGRLNVSLPTLAKFRQQDPTLSQATSNLIVNILLPNIQREMEHVNDLIDIFNYSADNDNESIELRNSLWRIAHRIEIPISLPNNHIYGANLESVMHCIIRLRFNEMDLPWDGRRNITRWYGQLNEQEKLNNFSRLIDFYKLHQPAEQVFATQIVAKLDIEYIDPVELLQQVSSRPAIMQFREEFPLRFFNSIRDNIDIIADDDDNTLPNLTASIIADRVQQFLLGLPAELHPRH